MRPSLLALSLAALVALPAVAAQPAPAADPAGLPPPPVNLIDERIDVARCKSGFLCVVGRANT